MTSKVVKFGVAGSCSAYLLSYMVSNYNNQPPSERKLLSKAYGDKHAFKLHKGELSELN